jgi:hypothetical protein
VAKFPDDPFGKFSALKLIEQLDQPISKIRRIEEMMLPKLGIAEQNQRAWRLCRPAC